MQSIEAEDGGGCDFLRNASPAGDTDAAVGMVGDTRRGTRRRFLHLILMGTFCSGVKSALKLGASTWTPVREEMSLLQSQVVGKKARRPCPGIASAIMSLPINMALLFPQKQISAVAWSPTRP